VAFLLGGLANVLEQPLCLALLRLVPRRDDALGEPLDRAQRRRVPGEARRLDRVPELHERLVVGPARHRAPRLRECAVHG
jgi:hypothetical protein